MKNLYLLIALMLFSTCSVADDSERLAAKKVLAAFEVKPYRERAIDIANVLSSSGVETSIDFEVLVSRFESLLKSDEFNHDMENIYIEYFTENELNEISILLQNQYLKKFLESRIELLSKSQGVMIKYLEKILSQP